MIGAEGARASAGSDREIVAGWAMVASGAALIGTCYGLARFAYGLFAPEFAAEFSLDSTVSGLIGAGSYVGYCLAIVVSLLLTPRWGARRVAVLAGVVATVGMSVVAAAPSAPVLAVGILCAGASTGIASPPLATAVSAWIRPGRQDRAQTVVNAGTGFGVLISGPVALVFMDQWRWAWAAFAVVAAVVTCWVHVTVPAGAATHPRSDPRASTSRRVAPGTSRLVCASFLMGVGSMAVWTFGRDLITTEGNATALVSAITWTVLGTSGILGALGGDVAQRIGLPVAWSALMVAMGAATALFAIAPSTTAVVLAAAALFGASYIGLTGLVLLWSTQVYPDRTSFGVGVSFFALAAGQATGAALVGRLTQSTEAATAFYVWAALVILGAALRPPAGRAATAAPVNQLR